MAERAGKGVSASDEAGNSYAVFRNQWVSFDTQSTVLEKVHYNEDLLLLWKSFVILYLIFIPDEIRY
jgi:hypothetical protein